MREQTTLLWTPIVPDLLLRWTNKHSYFLWKAQVAAAVKHQRATDVIPIKTKQNKTRACEPLDFFLTAFKDTFVLFNISYVRSI